MTISFYQENEKTLLHEDENFVLKYEIQNNLPFLHCTFKKFSHKIFLKCLVKFLDGVEVLHKEGYSEVFAITPKPKLAEMAGGQYIMDFEWFGEQYKVYKWGQYFKQ